MPTHANARLTQKGRLRLVSQHLHLRHIARLLVAPFSTAARALNRLGLGRLRNLEPKPPVQRYERERPGDLIHIDVKKLARFRQVGHRITGNRQHGRSTCVGYDRAHVASDDTTRLAYVEVLPDEQQATAIGFLCRAVAWFNGQGVECLQQMSDNGPAYVSRRLAKTCRHLASSTSEPGLHATHQRQGRAVYPGPLQGMGLCDAVPELPGEERLVAPLPVDL